MHGPSRIVLSFVAALGAAAAPAAWAQSFELVKRGTFSGGATTASEIAAFDPATDRLFVTNAATNRIDVVDASNVDAPALLFSIDVAPYGGNVNSVAVKNGLLAAAIEAVPKTTPGLVVVFSTSGTVPVQRVFPAGALPDNVTFSPNGNFILAANEGEPGGAIDPRGSVTIIDLAPGIAKATATTVDFQSFDGRENELRARGVRVFAGISASRDLEPEYAAVAPANDVAFVTLQEANAFAVINLATRTVTDIVPAGLKDHARGLPRVTTFNFPQLPLLGQTPALQDIFLGGFSGLWLESVEAGPNGVMHFVTVPDRGPNGEPTNTDGDAALERPFALPTYQPRVIRFDFDPASGAITLTGTVLLTRSTVVGKNKAATGGGLTPLTGLPNIAVVDEEPVDLNGNVLPLDPFGADLEGVVVAGDGTFWMCDEYRPAIYHFTSGGVLIDRFVPVGTGALGGQAPGFYGTETLPAVYGTTRRQNRGFEALAMDSAANILYAFIQTPLSNPDRPSGDASRVIRMVGIDMGTGAPVAEYVYVMEKAVLREQLVDKIGDAAYLGNGRFAIVERDDSVQRSGKKMLFEFTLTGATNLLAPGAPALLPGQTLEQHTPDELAQATIKPVDKLKVANLPSLGYFQGDKLEGLAALPGGRLAVLNDNDFGIEALPIPINGSIPLETNPTPIQLGFIDFDVPNGLDASDRDGPANGPAINIQNWPIYGMHMPDSIASFSAGGATFYASAGEGDDRGDPDVGRIASAPFTLDPTVFPNAAALRGNAQLGRLSASKGDGNPDGDGDFDRLQVLGSRSFIIWDRFGNLVFDSGDQLEQVTAAGNPANFNSDNAANQSFDTRSDNKGPEPEALAVGSSPEGRTYAFVGLERASAIVTFDVTNPFAPQFVGYTSNRDFGVTVDLVNNPAGAGDLGPEGIVFIAAGDSPTGQPMIAVSNEISGTTTLYSIQEALFKDSFE